MINLNLNIFQNMLMVRLTCVSTEQRNEDICDAKFYSLKPDLVYNAHVYALFYQPKTTNFMYKEIQAFHNHSSVA